LDVVTFAGFLDGINTSLVKEIELEEITEDSEIDLAIDFEKLYYNMHAATADWLYQLPEWDAILSEERRKEIKKQYNQSKIVVKDKKSEEMIPALVVAVKNISNVACKKNFPFNGKVLF
jgi:hypothetical protein